MPKTTDIVKTYVKVPNCSTLKLEARKKNINTPTEILDASVIIENARCDLIIAVNTEYNLNSFLKY